MTEPARGLNLNEVQLLARGRSEGLATAAVALGAVAFIQLLGAEKAILAIVLGVLALRGQPSQLRRGRSITAIVLGAVYLAITATTLILYHDKLRELIHLLQSLG